MFDTVKGGMKAPVASLPVAAAQGRLLTGVETRLMGLPAPLAALFPEGGIRKGSTVAVGPMIGGGSLALSLAGHVTGQGGWAAAVGWRSLGLVAAAELGVDLRRLALVPAPGDQWALVVAALVDGFDLLVLRPPARVRPADARRLAARIRERGAVVVLLDAPGWPESPDLHLSARSTGWDGLGTGHGFLRARRLEVTLGGRRVGGRERRGQMWLPSPPDRAVPGSRELLGAGDGGRDAPLEVAG